MTHVSSLIARSVLAAGALSLVGCGGSSSNAPSAEQSLAGEAAIQSASSRKAIELAVAGPQRSEENRARDQYRHPVETLSFFGVAPNQTVIELSPGQGWYTEILAPLLKDQGKLVAVQADIDSVPAEYRDYIKKMLGEYNKKLDAAPHIYGKVQRVSTNFTQPGEIAPPESADVVLTFRNMHNFAQSGATQAILKAAYSALKPGGILGITDHRAKPGDTSAESGKTGYLPEEYVIKQAEAAGFKLIAKSEINANPKDTKDYPAGVWALPPTYKMGDKDRDKYTAIGESDRMTLKFVKPSKS